MRIEVTTRGRLTRKGEPEIIVKIAIVPRGGANRSRAARMAGQVKRMEELKPYLKRVVAGSSSVTVYLVGSVELARVLANLEPPEKPDPAQLSLFGKLAV